MAKRKARPGREGGRVRALVAAGFAQEGLGLFLLGLGLLSALALGTYDPADPGFRFVPVANAAGVAGASIARLLVGGLGFGAAGPVLAGLALGVRFLTHGRLQFPNRRFWLGIALVLVALSTIPALLTSLGLGAVSRSAAGWLGRTLAGPERRLLSGPGALVLNVLALVVGAPSLFGIAPGETLTAIGRGSEAAARTVGGAVAQVASAALAGAARARVGLASGLAAFQVWRERRARRERVAALREPAPAAEDESVEAAEAAPAEAPRPVPRPRSPAAAPHIVD